MIKVLRALLGFFYGSLLDWVRDSGLGSFLALMFFPFSTRTGS